MDADELDAGVRTVAHLAGYFEELKQAARELTECLAPSQRGYFTTLEEERTRALLVSYWQARNALFELITSFRRDSQLKDDNRRQAFLTAFAAALILVDAARFLRESVQQHPIVQQKLNEGAPEFGIPDGVYDTIQQSLLRARHGWHLYHAIQYYQQEESQLKQTAADSGLGPVVEVIERLRDRLDVTVAQFARAKLRTRSDQIARRLAKSLVGRAMYGLQKLAGSLLADKYVLPGHQPRLPADVSQAVRILLSPGDVLIVRKEYALTNYFLPGYWPHAALYLGDIATLKRMGLHRHDSVKPRWNRLLNATTNRSDRVLESMKDGVYVRSLASPFASDSVVVLRPQLSSAEIREALARCLAHEGKPYDFDFDFRRSDRLVCTEVVYRAFDGVGSVELPLTRRAGRPTLSGSDLIHLALRQEHFQPIAVYAPGLTPGIVEGSQTEDVLRAGEGEADEDDCPE